MRNVQRLLLVLLLLVLGAMMTSCAQQPEPQAPAPTEAPEPTEEPEEEPTEAPEEEPTEAPEEEPTEAPEEEPTEAPKSTLDEITVAYFLEWPTANQVAQLEETYDEVMGVKVNWVSFDTGVAMSAAMASGDVHIAYSQGLVPFANAVTAGLPLQLVGVAVSYADNDNCVAATSAGITADNATDLEGQKVAVPIGTVAHYKMLREMEHLGVDVNNLEIVDLAPADGAAALQRGDVAMACGWGGALRRMKEHGNILMTGAEMEAIGIRVFDVVSVTDDFATDHPDLVTAFMQVTEDANAAYAADPTANEELIADAAGMTVEDSNAVLDLFTFPSSEEQLSDAWMGGTVQTFIKEVADFFVVQGELEESLDSYDSFINTSFLEQVTPAEWAEVAEPTTEAPAMDEEPIDEITVAYFLEWPTANQVAQLEETYDEVLGVKVNWVSFDTGVAMSAAMASGDVHIAYSQGLVPFANAVTAGLPLQLVGVAVSYADNDNCVAATSAGITADNATDLEGQKVAVPIGTVAHYKMLREMEYLGVDVNNLEIVDLAPADGAAALQRGDVAMACGWGGALRRMKENGNILMTGAEMEAIGIRVFDVVSVTDDFATKHPSLVRGFMQVTEDANAAYAADPTANEELIADAAGMTVEDSNAVLDLFTFPSSEEQLSDAWMGGTVQTFIKEVADFFVVQGELEESLDSYDQFINTSFLEQVTPAEWAEVAAAPAAEEEAPAEEEAMEEEAIDEITVAYFLEWPTANQVAQLEETYDEVMGVKVNWVSFDTGVAMSAAMASGDVHIAYSQGLVPFANAVTAGLPLQVVGVAVSYADNDNCVAATSANITADNATDLEGQKVAVPIGTVAHYKMLREMEHLGVDVNNLEIVDLAPADGAAALQRGDVAMACGWGGALRRMKENGNILMTGAEMEAIGIRVFDVVSVTDDFAAKHPSLVTAFMQVTEDANAAYAADPTANEELIADAAGMTVEDSNAVLDLFTFPSSEEQLSDAWMGGTVQTFIKEVADFFVVQGELEESLDSYDEFINTSFLEQVTPAEWAEVAAAPAAEEEAPAEEEAAEEEEAMEEEAIDEITVAYFLEWPTANQVAQLEETYDEVMGVKVNWVSFDTGVAMSAAMASGDVHIAYSQGLVPFANAVTAGLPLQVVGVAVSYADNDNCVAATSAGITADNATDLEGQKVAVPIGTVAHYKMLREMEHLGVDVNNLEIVDLAPADGAAALQRGDVAMACGWGGALRRMKENGNILMTGAEMEAIGIRVFDVVSVTDDFAAKHPSLVTAFMQVTEDANAAYAADPTANEELIADAAGMTVEDSNAVLDLFTFPSSEEQLSDAWMGGTVQTFIKEVADFFVVQGELEESLDSYDEFINTSFLEKVTPAEWAEVAAAPAAEEEAPAEEEAAEEEEAMEEEPIDEITVAYFLEWPTANQVAQLEETYDEVMGVKVNWVSFDTGVAMSAAMASGDVHIAYSQGLVPFANAVTAGLPLQVVGVAVSYADNDNCVAATSAGITADNATDLEGQKVAVPIGTVAHYKMLREMEHLGVDVNNLEIVDLAPADGAAALQRGDVAMACGWGGALRRMKENGNILMTGAEMEAIGIRVFDVVSVTDDFAAKHPSLVTAFMQVTEDANAAYAADPTANEELIADAAGMTVEDSNAVLDLFTFPSSEEQLSDAWMGGTVQTFIKEVADFFVEQGELEESLDSYDGFINTSFLEKVK